MDAGEDKDYVAGDVLKAIALGRKMGCTFEPSDQSESISAEA